MLHENEKAQFSIASETKKRKASSTPKSKQHGTLKTSTSTKDHVTFFTANPPQEQHHGTWSTYVTTRKDTTTEQHKTDLPQQTTQQHKTNVRHETTVQHPTTVQHRTTHHSKPTKGISPATCNCGEFPTPCPCSASNFNPIPAPKGPQSKTSDTKNTHPLPNPMGDASIKSTVSTTTAASITRTGAASGDHNSAGATPQVAEHFKNKMLAILIPVLLVFCALGALAIYCYFRGRRRREKVNSWFGKWTWNSSRTKHARIDTTEASRNAGYQTQPQPSPHAAHGLKVYFDDKLNDAVLTRNQTTGLPYENTIPAPAPMHGSTPLNTGKPFPRMQRYGGDDPYTMNGIPIPRSSTR